MLESGGIFVLVGLITNRLTPTTSISATRVVGDAVLFIFKCRWQTLTTAENEYYIYHIYSYNYSAK